MIDFLKKPYPFHENSKSALLTALGIGLFIGTFLLLLRPFGMHTSRGLVNAFKIFGYGGVTFIIVYLFFGIIPELVFKFINEQQWTIWKEITYLNIMTFAIASGNLLYTSIVFSNSGSNVGFLFMAMYTFLIGIIPTTFLVMYNQNKQHTKNTAESKSIHTDSKQLAVQVSHTLNIQTDKESIEIQSDQLMWIEPVGNYVKIVSQVDGQLKTHIFRATMKEVEGQVNHASIKRCHRSYIVNLSQVTNVNGNAQGFKLSLNGIEDVIPVSRKYVPIVKAYFSNK